jgi:hypothetical protein
MKLADASWMMVGDTARLISPIALLAAGATTDINIVLKVDSTFTGTSIVNNAEIESAENVDGSPATDVDSKPSDQDGTTPDGNDDDISETNGDDDYDPATILVDPYVSIGSTVFADNNDNGILNPATESGVAGVVVKLYADVDKDGIPDSAIPLKTDTTDVNGNYYFDSLFIGNYVVQVTPPDSLPLSSSITDVVDNADDNDDNGIQTMASGVITSPSIELTKNGESTSEPGQGGIQDDANDNDGNMTVDFGLVSYVSIGSTVFEDVNNNGTFDDATEAGIGMITVSLYADANVDGIPDLYSVSNQSSERATP